MLSSFIQRTDLPFQNCQEDYRSCESQYLQQVLSSGPYKGFVGVPSFLLHTESQAMKYKFVFP